MKTEESRSGETEESNNHNKDSSKSSDVSWFMEKFYPEYKPDFFQGLNGEYYVTLDDSCRKRTLRIGKNLCGDFLIKAILKFGHRGGRLREFANRIMDEFCGLAIMSETKRKVHIRAGRHQEDVYIDLGDQNGSLVHIKPKVGYKLVAEAPIRFLRPSNQLELPTPIHIETQEFLEHWKSLFNFTEDSSNYLLLAFVIHSLIPENGSYPMLLLEGNQGTGKSTASRLIKKLIDPTFPLLKGMHKREEDMYIGASQEYLLAFDNLSYISSDMADVCCRFVTGGGFSKRKHYSDDEQIVMDVRIPMIFNGIEEISDRPDFLDRAIVLHLKPIPKEERISETRLEERMKFLYPRLLSGIYTLVSQVLGNLDNVQDNDLPRMTDYARVGLALDKALKKEKGHFLTLFNRHISQKAINSFSSSAFCNALHIGLQKHHGRIEGSLTELYALFFKKGRSETRTGLPTGPKSFRAYLERYRSILEANNIEFGNLLRKSNIRSIFISFKDKELSRDHDEDYENLLG